MRRLAPALAAFVSVLVLDQATKAWALEALWDPPRTLRPLPGWLHLTPVENRGIAFGLCPEHGGVVVTAALVVLGLALWLNRRSLLAAPAVTRVAVGLIAGGAVGNLLDRVRLGWVVDFVTIPPIPLFRVFNVADASLTVSAVLLIASSLIADRRRPDPERRLARRGRAAR